MCEVTPAEETFDEKSAEGTLIPNKSKSSITPHDDTPAEETFIDKAAEGTLILNETKSPISMCQVTLAEETFIEKAAERSVIRKKTSSSVSGEKQGVGKESTVFTTSQGVVNSAISEEGDLSSDKKNTKDSVDQNSNQLMVGNAVLPHNVDQEGSIMHYDRTTVLSAMVFGGVQLYETNDYKALV